MSIKNQRLCADIQWQSVISSTCCYESLLHRCLQYFPSWKHTWQTDRLNCPTSYQCVVISFDIHTPIILFTCSKQTPRTYNIFCLLKENYLHGLSVFKFSVDQWNKSSKKPNRFWRIGFDQEKSYYWSQIPLLFNQVSYIISCISVIY